MLECLAFILKVIAEFLYMLFDIDVGFTSLGTLMCITFIFLPMALTVINFLKRVAIDELDEKYDFNYLLYGGNKNRYRGKHEYKPKHAKKY